jgi:acylphosphatase
MMSTMKRITRRYVVLGRVQGVGYRYFAKRVAGEYQLSGWVRNLPDGSVECHASGPVEDLENFEARLRKGPPMSDVRSVFVEDVASSDGSGDFHIR